MSEESNVADIRRAADRCMVLALRNPTPGAHSGRERDEMVSRRGRDWSIEDVPRRRRRSAPSVRTARQEAELRWASGCAVSCDSGPEPTGPGAA